MLSFILNWYAKSPLSSQIGAIDAHGGSDQRNAAGNSGAKATHTIDGTQGSRGLAIRVQAYASEVWSRAQQEVSKLSGAVTHKMQRQSTKLYSIAEKRNLARAASDMHATVLSKQLANRRELRTALYEDAVGATREDLADTQFDLLEEAKRQQMMSFGRLKDQLILQALVQKVYDSTNASVEGATNQAPRGTDGQARVSPYGGVTEKYQFVHYAPKAGDLEDSDFTADLIEDVKRQFAKNDVQGPICCAAMPDVIALLRKDTDFKNAENVFSPVKGSVDSERDTIMYKSVRWIPISETVRPELTDVPGTAANPIVRLLGSVVSVADSARGGTAARTTKRTGDRTLTGTVDTKIAYFWDKDALYFAERPDLMVARVDERVDAAYAKQVFLGVGLGACLIDSRHAVVLHLAGSVGAAT